MQGHKLLYRQTLKEALRAGERDLWRESHRENCSCARDIERAIGEGYKGDRLGDCAGPVIETYGFDRVNWVLANTVQQNIGEGRFSRENKEWAKRIYIPRDDSLWHFTVESHPGLVDLFLNQARRAWQALGLFEAGHCIPETDGGADYTGQVLALRPEVLKDAYKTSEDQLFFAEGGFGCSPGARGRKVYGQYLKDGESTHFYRQDFLGILRDGCLPGWAAERLAEIRPPEETPEGGMDMGM